MSYQFDTTQLTQTTTVKLDRNVANVRLLSRRNARQARRAQRAI